MRRNASHDRGPRRIACRRWAVGVCKEDTTLSESVEVWRTRLRVPAETSNPIVQVIDRYEQYVGLCDILRRKCPRQSDRNEAGQENWGRFQQSVFLPSNWT